MLFTFEAWSCSHLVAMKAPGLGVRLACGGWSSALGGLCAAGVQEAGLLTSCQVVVAPGVPGLDCEHDCPSGGTEYLLEGAMTASFPGLQGAAGFLGGLRFSC